LPDFEQEKIVLRTIRVNAGHSAGIRGEANLKKMVEVWIRRQGTRVVAGVPGKNQVIKGDVRRGLKTGKLDGGGKSCEIRRQVWRGITL